MKILYFSALLPRSNFFDSDDEFEESDDGSGATWSRNQGKYDKKTQKLGRQPTWSQELLNDVIDIIVNNEVYKTKLIFVNIKTQKNGEIYQKF